MAWGAKHVDSASVSPAFSSSRCWKAMEAHDPVPPLRRHDAALFRVGTGDPHNLAENVDPAVAPDGAGRDCAARGASSGAAESRVWVDGVGTSAVPRARCTLAMGGRARRHSVMVSLVRSFLVGSFSFCPNPAKVKSAARWG